MNFILLDTGVIGLLCASPLIDEVDACKSWVIRRKIAEDVVVIPDIIHYEFRRELIRIGAKAKLERLDNILMTAKPAEVTPEAWLKAAEFWAIVRQAGQPTADRHALDGDAILAGVAATIAGPDDLVTIATTNVVHLAWFPGIDARSWEAIS